MIIKDKNLYYVGGFVRDEILGINNKDIDFCYEGNAIEFAQKSGFNILKTNPNFGTVRILFDNKEIDIASTRRENYPQKGHLPNVFEVGCSLEEDLKRRDFTINAIAKRTTDGKIIDIYRGLKDIENKELRILHDESFIDDPTRIIRGLKFVVRLGFELEKHTRNLQEEYLRNINYDMSYHRLKNELVDLFNLNKAEALYRFINEDIYKLLGRDVKKISIEKAKIKEMEDILNQNSDALIWLAYLSFFNLSNLDLTRSEKRILEWAERLNNENVCHNTPPLSIIINDIRKKIL